MPDTPADPAQATAPGTPWYVTTAIPYVNARPHIGFALEITQTDALARWRRLIGQDTRFLTGTDDNSLKNVRAAEKAGLPTQEFVNQNAAAFYALRDTLTLSFDDFIRTSADPRHAAGVRKLWEACARSGDIYRRPYRGLYCVGCEQFYTEDELVDGLCPEHLTPPEVVEEENYFFRLSRYAEQLRELIESDTLRIVPQTRKNEVLGLIRGGLEDFSLSRSQARAHGWGIPVPGDDSQVMYVWFDALGNYITALDYADDGPLYERYWVNNLNRTHVIGKGITRFHAVYWPAMLLSAGVPLPTTIFVHGYVTIEGEKISKSLGNAIDPVDVTERYGVDALRYYLLREIPATDDGDFARERLVRTYNNDLADRLGNLLNRSVSMVKRYYDGVVPEPGEPGATEEAVIAVTRGLSERVTAALDRFSPNDALAEIWELVNAANKYVEDSKPWALAKRRAADPQAEERLRTTLYTLVEALRLIALYSSPFIPTAAEGIAAQLGVALTTNGDWATASRWGGYPAGTTVAPAGVLFPKLELPETVEATEATA